MGFTIDTPFVSGEIREVQERIARADAIIREHTDIETRGKLNEALIVNLYRDGSQIVTQVFRGPFARSDAYEDARDESERGCSNGARADYIGTIVIPVGMRVEYLLPL